MSDAGEDVADTLHGVHRFSDGFEPEPFRHVAFYGDIIDNLTAGAHYHGIGAVLVVKGSVFLFTHETAGPDTVPLQRVAERPVKICVLLAAVQHVQIASHGFFFCVARHLLESGIHILDDAPRVGYDHGFGGRFSRCRQADALLFSLFARTANFGVTKFPLHGRGEPCQVALDDIVVRALPHRLDGDVLADISRDDDEWKIESAVLEHAQSMKTAEPGHNIVRDDDVPLAPRKRLFHVFARINPLEDGFIAVPPQFEEQQPCVVFGILDHQYVKWFIHNI